MAFPSSLIPNNLQPETQREVDGNPSILNARDYNIHQRELRAIEKRLLASTSVIQQIMSAYNYIAGGKMFRGVSGEMTMTQGSTQTISVPADIPSTTCLSLTASATSVTVSSTTGFPDSGYITKFNNNVGEPDTPFSLLQSAGGYKATDQEIISYTSKTATSFEGCTRGALGTTKQDLPARDSPLGGEGGEGGALILGGMVFLFLAPSSIAMKKQTIYEFSIEHDARLRVAIQMLDNTGPITGETAMLRYSLTAAGQFPAIDLGELLD